MGEDPVVAGEATVPPRQQKLDPLLAQQPSAAEQTQHLVAEQLLRRSLVHVRHRNPLPGGGPASPGHKRVHVGVKVRPVPKCLDHRDHPGPKGLLLPGRRRQELLHRLRRRPHELSQKLPVVQEVDPQHLGDREDPLGVTYVLHHLLGEKRPKLRRSL